MASYKSKAIINKTSRKENPGSVNSSRAGGGKLFHGYTVQTGAVDNTARLGRRPGGPTHNVGNKAQVGGPYKSTGKPLRAGTRKNSLQGSDSNIVGTGRGKRAGGGDTAKKARTGRPVGPF